MKRLSRLTILLTLVGWLLLSACGGVDRSASAESACAEPTSDLLLLNRQEQGYCLLFPATHTLVDMENGATEIVVGELMNHIDPRLSIFVEDLDGRSLDQIVAEFLSGYEGFEIVQSDITLGGQSAAMLDGIPGQDYYRTIFAAHNGRLYRLSILPFDPANTESLPQAQTLLNLTVETFRFIDS